MVRWGSQLRLSNFMHFMLATPLLHPPRTPGVHPGLPPPPLSRTHMHTPATAASGRAQAHEHPAHARHPRPRPLQLAQAHAPQSQPPPTSPAQPTTRAAAASSSGWGWRWGLGAPDPAGRAEGQHDAHGTHAQGWAGVTRAAAAPFSIPPVPTLHPQTRVALPACLPFPSSVCLSAYHASFPFSPPFYSVFHTCTRLPSRRRQHLSGPCGCTAGGHHTLLLCVQHQCGDRGAGGRAGGQTGGAPPAGGGLVAGVCVCVRVCVCAFVLEEGPQCQLLASLLWLVFERVLAREASSECSPHGHGPQDSSP